MESSHMESILESCFIECIPMESILLWRASLWRASLWGVLRSISYTIESILINCMPMGRGRGNAGSGWHHVETEPGGGITADGVTGPRWRLADLLGSSWLTTAGLRDGHVRLCMSLSPDTSRRACPILERPLLTCPVLACPVLLLYRVVCLGRALPWLASLGWWRCWRASGRLCSSRP